PKQRRTEEQKEIAAYLITFEKHEEWLTTSPKTRPQNGSMILYNRKKVKYRKDGYCWKKRKDGKTTREDHMKLKVQGVECLYGCYVHSSIIPTFHRRCYWLLQNPDIVLVHYLNVPAVDDSGKPCGPVLCSINTDRKEWAKWSKEELIGQLKPMCAGSSLHQKCSSVKQRIISSKQEPGAGVEKREESEGSEVQNSDVSEGQTETTANGTADRHYHSDQFKGAICLATGILLTVTPENSQRFHSFSGGVGLGDGGELVLSSSLDSTSGVSLPETTMTFDPDCFLNNPKQGQTYGGGKNENCNRSDELHCPVNVFYNAALVNNIKTEATNLEQPLANASGYESTGLRAGISLEGFEASFGSQFSDLINDFISVEGSGAGVGGAVMMTQEAGGPEDQGSAQTHLQGTGVEQASLGLLQETGRLFGVTDYSPEWSYPEGGVKVLITGPWLESTSDYSCFFDHISVPAALIQPGVLRCYCPAHDTGLVMLQVAMGGDVISSSVVFEYKARDLPALPSSQHDWLSLDDTQFRMSILERLEQMEQRMAEISNPNPNSESTDPKGGGAEGGSSFEARVLSLCEQMMAQSCWGSGSDLDHSKNSRGMTLLHLAAAQGYAGLINALRRWRTKHSGSIELELEVDPLNVDHFSCTPLMWACALGHTDSALLLYHWDHRALSIPDSLGRLPLTIARSRGHTHLAELLEQTPPSTSSASSSSGTQRPAHTTKGQQSDSGSEQREIAAVIQRCYKRYKQFALYKRMTLAAVLIQSRFRSLIEQKKFQQSRRAAVLIQQYYRSYRHSLSRLLSKKQNQAARKILKFLLRCRHR
uniref:Calmodulin-binding transcription activator 1 n=1 Tax=Periophthalmus magnuspinnatus TaxID=409849 RepID=A0A3B4B275_9GOBI